MADSTSLLEINQTHVSEAFSAQAPAFDKTQISNEILVWMRNRVHQIVGQYLKYEDTILELNAGTGIDAVHFAKQGHSVVAVDNAVSMVEHLKKKAESNKLTEKITAYHSSFMSLNKLPPQKFDYVFSNFGGLNCVPDLTPVAIGLKPFLKVGAFLSLAIMPPVCPWELLYFFRGHAQLAFRRLRKGGTLSRIEGHHFLSWYFTPRQIIQAFGNDFKVVDVRGIASLVPPPYMELFPKKYPRLLKILKRIDERVSVLPPFNRWADYFVITLQYSPV